MIRSPADHGLTTRSPMASGGFGIAAHVRLRCAFPLDWTRVSCRKYGSESDFGSPVQAQLLALRERTHRSGRGSALFLSVWDDAGERRECIEAANNNNTTTFWLFPP